MFHAVERHLVMTDHSAQSTTPPVVGLARRHRRLILAVAAGALLPVAGCGDDDTDAAGGHAAYCDSAVALDQTLQAVDADDPENFASALAAAQEALSQAAALAPSEVTEEYAVLEAALGEVVDTGNPESYFTDEVTATEVGVHAHDLEQCDWAAVAVVAEDYAFVADWPTAPGPVSFDVTNSGAEPHVLIVARKLDSVSGSALEAFQAAEREEDVATSFEFAASVFVAPGTSDYALADLAAGDYVVFCPVPVGTTGEGTVGDGPPHHLEGMLAAFELA